MYEHLEKNIALWQERIGNASARIQSTARLPRAFA